MGDRARSPRNNRRGKSWRMREIGEVAPWGSRFSAVIGFDHPWPVTFPSFAERLSHCYALA